MNYPPVFLSFTYRPAAIGAMPPSTKGTARGLMARKLKTHQTSLGFYDLALAAPSMKAALEAWGAESNLFHQGVAKESEDPEVVAATMAIPGVILRRPVGPNGPFTENAALPTDLSDAEVNGRPKGSRAKPKKKAVPRDRRQGRRRTRSPCRCPTSPRIRPAPHVLARDLSLRTPFWLDRRAISGHRSQGPLDRHRFPGADRVLGPAPEASAWDNRFTHHPTMAPAHPVPARPSSPGWGPTRPTPCRTHRP